MLNIVFHIHDIIRYFLIREYDFFLSKYAKIWKIQYFLLIFMLFRNKLRYTYFLVN